MNSALTSLLKNYFLISTRRLIREKAYVAICVISLAIGMASILIVGSYVYHELSYDRHQENFNDIYMLYGERKSHLPTRNISGYVPYNLGRMLIEEYPNIGSSVEFADDEATIRKNDVQRAWDRLFFVDSTVFEIFSHQILAGDPNTAFLNLHSIAVSESFARYYFGRTDVLGEVLEHNDTDVSITLVFSDLPDSTFFHYDALLPTAFGKNVDTQLAPNDLNFNIGGPSTFIKIHKDFDVRQFDALTSEFVDRHQTPQQKEDEAHTFNLRKLGRMHIFSGDIRMGIDRNSTARFFSLIGIGLCIILVAGVNTINLNTARVLRRIEEMKTQRTLGASQRLLLGYMLIESLFLGLCALLLAHVLLELYSLLPVSEILNNALTNLSWTHHPLIRTFLFGLCIVFGIVCGCYPIHRHSISNNKTKFETAARGRKSSLFLVATQFVVAISGLIIGYFFIQQANYFYDKDLGLDIENRMLLRFNSPDDRPSITRIESELEGRPFVQSVSSNMWSPGRNSTNINSFLPAKGTNNRDPNRRISLLIADSYFPATIGMRPIFGSLAVRQDRHEHPHGVVITDSVLDLLGWRNLEEQEIIGKPLDMYAWPDGIYQLPILAVVKDFHARSLFEANLPTIIVPPDAVPFPPEWKKGWTPHLTVHFVPGYDQKSALDQLREITQRHIPHHPFNYEFLDNLWRDNYGNEEKERDQLAFFCAIAIILCLLGLSGLSAYTVEAKTKELGIRKIIGASGWNLLSVITYKFFWLGLIASFPAWLAAYYISERWLAQFAYRISISFWPFVGATLAIIFLSQITIIIQSWRATHQNPIESLRYE